MRRVKRNQTAHVATDDGADSVLQLKLAHKTKTCNLEEHTAPRIGFAFDDASRTIRTGRWRRRDALRLCLSFHRFSYSREMRAPCTRKCIT